MLRPEDCKPGTLVECIRAEGTILDARSVYVIEKLHKRTLRVDGVWCPAIWLDGANERGGGGPSDRWAYDLSRFRLLPDERLSIFRAMLAKSPVPVKESV